MQTEENIDNQYAAPTLKETVANNVAEYAPTPNDPPWNGLMAFLVWLASVVAIIVFPFIFLIPYALSQNIDLANAQDFAKFATGDKTAILFQIAAVFPAHVLTLILCWFVVTNVKKYPFFKTLGWSMGSFRWWQFPIILGLFFIFAAVISTIFPEQENELTKILASSRAAVFIVAIMATFSAPIVEEVVYRGIVYSGFQKTFNVPVAVIVTTVLFAGVHYPQYWGSWGTIILITALSLILTFIRVQSNNLLPCVVLHFIFNGIQSVLLLLEPYLKQAAPKEQIPAMLLHLFK